MYGPLAAQTLNCDFSLTQYTAQEYEDRAGVKTSQDVRTRLHVYISQGATVTPRTVLIDNWTDPSVAWTFAADENTGITPQAIAGSVQAGDYIIVEYGVQTTGVPTPTPNYPPDDMLLLNWLEGCCESASITAAALPALADGVIPSTTSGVPYMDFSQHLIELDEDTAVPSNDTYASAIDLGSLPASVGPYDTTRVPNGGRVVWFTFTAAQTGIALTHVWRSTYPIFLLVYEGTPSGAGGALWYSRRQGVGGTSISAGAFPVTAGQTYYLRVQMDQASYAGRSTGGILYLSCAMRQAPQEDDLYLAASGYITVWRNGQLVNMLLDFAPTPVSGIAFDYSRSPMDSLNGGTNTNIRVLLALHSLLLVEVLDYDTLNINQNEIGFFDWDPVPEPPPMTPGSITGSNLSALLVRGDGMLFTGAFGNGYRLVSGRSLLPAFLNSVSDEPWRSGITMIPAYGADTNTTIPKGQGVLFTPACEVGGTNWTTFNVDETEIYYTSGSYYDPVGGYTIKRMTTAGVQLPDFATLSPGPGPNPGARGLRMHPDGTLLVCNGNVVQRLSAAGVVIHTYTPTPANRVHFLADVDITADGTKFWTHSASSADLFQFDLETGAQLQHVRVDLGGATTSFVLLRPSGFTGSGARHVYPSKQRG